METVELADGGILLFDDAFLPPDLADRYFSELRDQCAWEQKPGVFGHMQPRLTASYGDEGMTYRYSGTENQALPWTPTLLEIKRKIEAVQGRYNYCLLNCYRSGADSVGMHADDEPGMGNVIGSLSLGATRTFRIRHNKTKETRTFPVGNGTLVIMAGTMQRFWKHEVPKTTENVGKRINLTFRMIGITGSILDAGCGTGENALFFAGRGQKVAGIDFLTEPINRAKRKTVERGLMATFLVMDALALKELPEVFDAVIDSGLFHVFNDDDRRRYLEGLATVLKPGGRLFLLCFSNDEPGEQGPRRVTKKELHAAFAEGWKVESIDPSRYEVRPDLKDISFSEGGPKAWYAVIRRHV